MAYDQTIQPGAASSDPYQANKSAMDSFNQQQGQQSQAAAANQQLPAYMTDQRWMPSQTQTQDSQFRAQPYYDQAQGSVNGPGFPGGQPDPNMTDWSQAYQTGQSGGVVNDPTSASSGLQNALTSRINQGLAIDPQTDSVIRPQVDAFAANATRSNRDLLNDNAEANGPYATGAQNTARTQAAEKESQDINGLQAQLVQNELNARRGDINSATNDMGGLLGADQQLNLQRQQGGVNANLSQQQLNNTLGLGMLGANLQQQGITNQNQQFFSGLSQQDQQFLNNLSYQYAGLNSANQNAANQLGYQYAGLNSANSNYDKGLGFQYAGLNSANSNFDKNLGYQYAGLNSANANYDKGLGFQYAGLNSANTNAANQLDLQKQQLQSNNDQFSQNFGLNSTNQANYWDAIRSGLL